MVKIDEILKDQHERNRKREKMYKKIYKLAEKKIIDCSKVNNKGCYFSVPVFLISIPTYSSNECKRYLINKLKDDGFRVEDYDTNTIYISWNV